VEALQMRGTTSHRLLGHWLLGLGTVAAGLCLHSEARADLHLAIGTKVEPLSYTSAYFPNAASSTVRPEGSSTDASQSFQLTSLTPYIAMYIAQKYGIVLSLDLGYAQAHGETQAMGMAMATTDTNSYFKFGVSLGTKIYFSQPRSQKVVPYLYVDGYKYFASVSTDNQTVTGDQAGAQASLRSPAGFTIALGAEYFLSPGFSIGSEIFGLRPSWVTSDYKDAQMTRHSSSYTQVSLYTGLTLNYRFQISSSVRAAEDEGSAEAAKRRRSPSSEEFVTPAAPPPPPPPSPEAVD
jgi:hypothetical protein